MLPIRFPKLKYRNQQFTDPATKTEQAHLPFVSQVTSLEYDQASHAPSIPLTGTTRPLPESQGILTSQLELPNTSSAPRNRVKSHASSLFKFLKIKEPSTKAWLDCQESARRQQISSNGRNTAAGMPMVSTAKLPSTVPKVNSKWDGVPPPVKKNVANQHNSTNRSSPISFPPVHKSISGGHVQNLRQASGMSDQQGPLSHTNSHFSDRTKSYSCTSGSSILASSIQAPSLASTMSLPELSPCVTPVSLSPFMEHGANYEELEVQTLKELRVPLCMHARPATPLDTSPRTPPPPPLISTSQQPTQSLSPKSLYSHPYFSTPLDLDTMLCNSTFHEPATTSTTDVRSEYHPINESKSETTPRNQGISYWKPPKSW